MHNSPPLPFNTSPTPGRRIRRFLPALLVAGTLALPIAAAAHGSLENGRMLQVRLAGPGGHAPAPWTESYYTWNQNSNTFPGYAAANFRYADTVPDGTLASAGINDGVHSSLNFSGLNNASAAWQQTAVAAGGSVRLHWLATALHDPSHFQVYLTRAGVNPDTSTLAWADLEFLEAWAVGNTARPVSTSVRPNPASGGTMPSYDWDVPVPADRVGHAALLVIWQRDDPAGEAFFAVLDLKVNAAAAIPAQLALTRSATGGISLDLRGTPGQNYDLQAADALDGSAWTVLATGTADSTGHWLTSDPNAAGHPRRFYRAVPHP